MFLITNIINNHENPYSVWLREKIEYAHLVQFFCRNYSSPIIANLLTRFYFCIGIGNNVMPWEKPTIGEVKGKSLGLYFPFCIEKLMMWWYFLLLIICKYLLNKFFLVVSWSFYLLFFYIRYNFIIFFFIHHIYIWPYCLIFLHKVKNVSLIFYKIFENKFIII